MKLWCVGVRSAECDSVNYHWWDKQIVALGVFVPPMDAMTGEMCHAAYLYIIQYIQ